MLLQTFPAQLLTTKIFSNWTMEENLNLSYQRQIVKLRFFSLGLHGSCIIHFHFHFFNNSIILNVFVVFVSILFSRFPCLSTCHPLFNLLASYVSTGLGFLNQKPITKDQIHLSLAKGVGTLSPIFGPNFRFCDKILTCSEKAV